MVRYLCLDVCLRGIDLRYIDMLQVSDNRDRDSATALFMHSRDECKSSGSVRPAESGARQLLAPLTRAVSALQYLGLIHVVALAHALRRTVIMMDRGDEMTDCAFGYHAVRVHTLERCSAQARLTLLDVCATTQSSGTFTPFRGLSADEGKCCLRVPSVVH